MKNILMYDNSHGYMALMKKLFKEEFQVWSYKKIKSDELNLELYDAVFFIINNEIELIDLMFIYTKVENLFVFSSYRKLNERLNELDNITILNLHKSKKQIAEQIRFWLDVFKPINKIKTD